MTVLEAEIEPVSPRLIVTVGADGQLNGVAATRAASTKKAI